MNVEITKKTISASVSLLEKKEYWFNFLIATLRLEGNQEEPIKLIQPLLDGMLKDIEKESYNLWSTSLPT
jgi:hypothetical protein